MLIFLQMYFVLGLAWSLGYTGWFIYYCFKHRQVRPIDLAIVVLFVVIFFANLAAWPLAIKNSIKNFHSVLREARRSPINKNGMEEGYSPPTSYQHQVRRGSGDTGGNTP